MCVRVCVCACACVRASAMFVNASHKADIHLYKDVHKNELHDYGEYIYPLSISKLREGYALSKCFSFRIETTPTFHLVMPTFHYSD